MIEKKKGPVPRFKKCLITFLECSIHPFLYIHLNLKVYNCIQSSRIRIFSHEDPNSAECAYGKNPSVVITSETRAWELLSQVGRNTARVGANHSNKALDNNCVCVWVVWQIKLRELFKLIRSRAWPRLRGQGLKSKRKIQNKIKIRALDRSKRNIRLYFLISEVGKIVYYLNLKGLFTVFTWWSRNRFQLRNLVS